MDLTDQELVLLDGKCSSKIQTEVDAAKGRIAMQSKMSCEPHIAAFVADAVKEAKEHGLLRLLREDLRYCRYCKKSAGYYTYPRTGRYHRRGETDYGHPKYMSGVELADRFISVKGYSCVGCCSECWQKAQPLLAKELEGVMAEVSEAITGHKPMFKKWDNMKCEKCNWEGHEGQMGRLPCLLGVGYYQGKCPQCGAENRVLNNKIKHTKGFTVVTI